MSLIATIRVNGAPADVAATRVALGECLIIAA
jgi:hypothetical protein